MSDNTCVHCGVGINHIYLRDGMDWCHTLGGRRCAVGDSFARPALVEESGK